MLEMRLSEHEKVTFQGFAYSGGGRRVIVVEISLNEGHDWTMAELFVSSILTILPFETICYREYPEDLYKTVAHEDSVFGSFEADRDTCL